MSHDYHMTYHIRVVRVIPLAEDLRRHPTNRAHLPVREPAVFRGEEVPAQTPVSDLDMEVLVDTGWGEGRGGEEEKEESEKRRGGGSKSAFS